jgi:hypothetical protein
MSPIAATCSTLTQGQLVVSLSRSRAAACLLPFLTSLRVSSAFASVSTADRALILRGPRNMEPSKLIRVEISSASYCSQQVCGVSGERISHSEKGTRSIAEKEPRRVFASSCEATFYPALVDPLFADVRISKKSAIRAQHGCASSS